MEVGTITFSVELLNEGFPFETLNKFKYIHYANQKLQLSIKKPNLSLDQLIQEIVTSRNNTILKEEIATSLLNKIEYNIENKICLRIARFIYWFSFGFFFKETQEKYDKILSKIGYAKNIVSKKTRFPYVNDSTHRHELSFYRADCLRFYNEPIVQLGNLRDEDPLHSHLTSTFEDGRLQCEMLVVYFPLCPSDCSLA